MLSDEKVLKLAKWLEQFNADELDLIARLVWKARQKNFTAWDKQLAGNPYKKKRK